MKSIVGHVVSAGEFSGSLGRVGLAKALLAFEEFPWAEELSKVERTGVFPTLSFAAPDDHDSYINITPNEDGSFLICTEAILRPAFLGMFFGKTAYRDTDDAGVDEVREQIKEFFELECHELFDRIQQENRDRR